MAAHTPGPWVWAKDGNLYSAANLVEWNAFIAGDMSGDWVSLEAIVETDGGHYAPRGWDRTLIAAAPDLLAALKELAELRMGRGDGVVGDYVESVGEIARAAIAKAEGLSEGLREAKPSHP